MFDLNKSTTELEILTLRADVFLKARVSEEDFWKYVSQENYKNLKKCGEYLHSCFGSTYLCESAFSVMNFIKTKNRSSITDSHLHDSLALYLSGYAPDFTNLVQKNEHTDMSLLGVISP